MIYMTAYNDRYKQIKCFFNVGSLRKTECTNFYYNLSTYNPSPVRGNLFVAAVHYISNSPVGADRKL